MKLVHCDMGHLYDQDRYASCPECRKETSFLHIPGRPEPEPPRSRQYLPCDRISLPPETGEVEVIEKMGEGSTGQVYRVRQAKEFAVKVISWAKDGGRKNALREYELSSRLQNSRYVIPCLRCYEQDNATFLVQELSTPWFKWYKSHPCRVTDVLHGVLNALEAVRDIHAAGISHFDIKPGNLFVSEAGVRIGDFSHALPVRTGESYPGYRGTLPFMAPEVYGDAIYNGTEDLYSLGATLYTLLTGSIPYGSAGEPSRIRQKEDRIRTLFLCEDLIRIVEKATAYRPEDRYQTPDEFSDAIRGFIGANLSLMAQEIPGYTMIHRIPGAWDGSTTLTVSTMRSTETASVYDKS